jgi:hypothetical protein
MKRLFVLFVLFAVSLSSCDISDGINDTIAYNKAKITTSNNSSLHPTNLEDFTPPEQGSEMFSFTVSADDLSNLGIVQNQFLDSLSFDIEQENQKVDKYNFYGVSIENIDYFGNYAKVTIKAKKRNSILGISFNPGPAPDARPITTEGPNTAWVHQHKAKIGAKGIAIELNDFYADAANGVFRMEIIPDSQAISLIEELIVRQGKGKELILMLPVRSIKEYTEFKLWNSEITGYSEDDLFSQFEFSSNDILQLIGE